MYLVTSEDHPDNLLPHWPRTSLGALLLEHLLGNGVAAAGIHVDLIKTHNAGALDDFPYTEEHDDDWDGQHVLEERVCTFAFRHRTFTDRPDIHVEICHDYEHVERKAKGGAIYTCLLYTSPSPRD